jgi:hypothetical protein
MIRLDTTLFSPPPAKFTTRENFCTTPLPPMKDTTAAAYKVLHLLCTRLPLAMYYPTAMLTAHDGEHIVYEYLFYNYSSNICAEVGTLKQPLHLRFLPPTVAPTSTRQTPLEIRRAHGGATYN